MQKRYFILVIFAVLAGINVPAVAQEEAPSAATEQETQTEKPALTPAQEKQKKQSEKVNTRLSDLVRSLDESQKKHFFMTYSSSNLYDTVEMVQKDVKTAVTKCGENNPDMKEAMDTRYKAWDAEISPVMAEAKANIDNMIAAQDYADPKDIRAIFSDISKSRTEAQNEIEKIPVTTPEACEYLRNKMDETQERMIGLLRSTLVTLPQAEIKAGEGAVAEKPAEETQAQ